MPRKHKKKQTALDTSEADKAIPKSIIIYRGEVGPQLRSLMHEWRRVFAPWASRKLHARRNTLRDFVSIASTFSVSHLQLFSAPPHGASLRIIRFINGPTISFRVESFALRQDVVATQKKPAPVDGAAYDVAPVVVLNNFNLPNRPPEVELMESTFQSLFPSVDIQTVKHSQIQRVVLFHYDALTGLVEVRHYYITTKATGLSKTVKKLMEGRIPTKLGSLENVDEVLDKEGAWSDTDGEGEEVPLHAPFRQHKSQCRVKLLEVGPRMTLQLLKIEAGFCGGEVLYHHHVVKTEEEIATNAQRVHQRALTKAKRKKDHEEKVQEKKAQQTEKIDRKKRRRFEKEQQKAAEEVSTGEDEY